MAYEIGSMVSSQEDIAALFTDVEESNPVDTQPKNEPEEETKNNPPKEKEEEITEITPQDLFGGESERVGDDNDINPEGEEGELSKQKGSSPDNLYSSIANSLAEDGTLSNLSDDELSEIKDPESLVAAMKKQVDSMLEDEQRRVKDALEAGMQPSQIQRYENSIRYLESLTDDQLSTEDTQGEELRKDIIYNYHLSLGMSEEKANKMVDRAFAGGTDIEDAREYLDALKEHYKGEYSKLIEDGKKQAQEAKRKQEEAVKKMKETLLKDSKIMGDIEIDSKTRQLAFDNWMKPTHKTENGVYQSAIQKYIAENPTDFQMKVALLFTMTEGFTKMGNVLKQAVKKEKKKALQELEHTINNTQRTPSGTLNLRGMKGDDMFGGLEVAPTSTWR